MTVQSDLEHATGAAVARLFALETENRTLRGQVAELTERIAELGLFPGRAPRMLSGAAIGGNDNPAVFESQIGRKLPIRRTFFNKVTDLAPTGPLAATVKADHAAGRLPWVSIKLPWRAAADGWHDAGIMGLLTALDALGKPVWLILNHEPENDGGSATDFRNMQKRFRDLMDEVGTKNISFGGCLMSWTFDPRSGRRVADWWPGDGVWDWLGADHYTEVGDDVLAPASWGNFLAFARSKKIPPAVPEWGVRRDDPNMAVKMRTLHHAMLEAGVVGAAYFHSNLNSTLGGWALNSAGVKIFAELL